MANQPQGPQQQETAFEIQIPPELEPGAYANFLSVWHTPLEFTMDFAATQPSQQTDTGMKVPCRVVARLRIPPPVMLDVLGVLNENIGRYQQSFGEINRPGQPLGGDAGTHDRTEDRPGAGGYH
jgi:Protein of unknown function (DUF3467)